MNTAMDLRVKMVRTLPNEVQEVIWRSYFSDTVLPWLILEVEQKMLNASYEELFDKYHDIVVDTVERLRACFQHQELFFQMNMDFVEDRLFDVITTQEGREMFEMYQVIKDNITDPYLLKLELICLVDKLRTNGRGKLHSCILCRMMLARLRVMIAPIAHV